MAPKINTTSISKPNPAAQHARGLNSLARTLTPRSMDLVPQMMASKQVLLQIMSPPKTISLRVFLLSVHLPTTSTTTAAVSGILPLIPARVWGQLAGTCQAEQVGRILTVACHQPLTFRRLGVLMAPSISSTTLHTRRLLHLRSHTYVVLDCLLSTHPGVFCSAFFLLFPRQEILPVSLVLAFV